MNDRPTARIFKLEPPIVSSAPPAPEIEVQANGLPKSATHMGINCTGLGVFLATLFALRDVPLDLTTYVLICLAAWAIPIAVLEFVVLKTYRRASTGLDGVLKGKKVNWNRVFTKLLGFYATLGVLGLAYWLFPIYSDGMFLQARVLVDQVFPVFALLTIPYFVIVDMMSRKPEDDPNWQIGMACRGKVEHLDRQALKQHVLAWCVKGFFLPIMLAFLYTRLNVFRWGDLNLLFGDFERAFGFLIGLLFLIDLAIVSVGYTLSLKIFDSHNRSSEPSLLGWSVALVCYWPFWEMFSKYYLPYGDGGPEWTGWLAGHPVLMVVWGVTILLLTGLYVWASVPFGLRFSNLTNRGILTNGPYRYSKHPAYLSKNLSWWLISMPFLSTAGPAAAVKASLMLLALNAFYVLRARTEERHLSADPTYVAYATAMNDVALFSKLGKRWPWLQYTPPTEYRSPVAEVHELGKGKYW